MISECGLEEALEILNEPQNVKSIGFVSQSLLKQPHIVKIKGHKLLFFFWFVGNKICEMHIACPKKSIVKSRQLAKSAMKYVFSQGCNKIVTNASYGKIANMAIKIGMKEYTRNDEKIFFEAEKWA